VLRGAAVAVGTAVTGAACTRHRPAPPDGQYLIVVTTAAGVSGLDQDGRVVVPPTVVPAATGDWRHSVTAEPAGDDTRMGVRDLLSGRRAWEHTLPGRLEPRIISPDGRLVAAVPPGGAGVYGLHQPQGRARTTVVVADGRGEVARFDLTGNIEPYAFSTDGRVLYALDFVPADKPDRFGLRAVDLTTGRMSAVSNRDGGEYLRAHRVDSVHDARRGRLYALYAWPAGSAFVHALHLGEGWARRIDLPAPFGRERPGVHAIALSPTGDRLAVVHSISARVAEVDLDRLVVTGVSALAPDGQRGKPNARFTPAGRLVVNVDTKVIATGPYRETATPGEARGLVVESDTAVWAGHPDGVVRYDLTTGARTGSLDVPDLYVLKDVFPVSGSGPSR